MPPIQSEEELNQFINTAKSAASDQRTRLGTSMGAYACYYEGLQYLARQNGAINYQNTTVGRLFTQLNPDRQALRVISNQITQKTIVAAAATYPTAFSPTVEPPIRDSGPQAASVAQTLEDLTVATIHQCGLLGVAQDVNLWRCINGSYGIGLSVRSQQTTVMVEGQPTPMLNKTIKAIPVHPIKFILDPGIEDRDLTKHDYVIYEDVWTIDALRAAYPQVQFDPNDMQTMGQLCPVETQMNNLSDGRLYSRYRQFSQTKAARIYQVHRKDATGRFSEYYVGIEYNTKVKDNTISWVNQDDPRSPFGGNGLPFALIHGHRRSSGVWGIGEVGMSMDSQDIINLMMTMILRHVRMFTSASYVVDRRWFGTTANDNDIHNQISNAVGGAIIGRPPSMDKSVMPPQLTMAPSYQPGLLEMLDRSSDKMRDDTFRAEVTTGSGMKSHVSSSVVNTMITQSDRVLGIRRTEDCQVYQELLQVLLGTQIKHIQEQTADSMAMLDREGFDQQDVMAILETDPYYPTCGMKLSEADLIYRSSEEKRSVLADALARNAITADQYQRGMAEMDYALSGQDRYMKTEIDKKVARLLLGEPWTALPLGGYGSWALQALRQALFDGRVKANPEMQQMVIEAINMQTQANVQEQLASDPNVAMAQMQAQQQAQAQAPVEEPQPTTLAELIGST